jgi:phage anti-repressor protein
MHQNDSSFSTIIPVSSHDQLDQVVDARGLWTALQVSTRFADWVKRRLSEMYAIENTDYCVIDPFSNLRFNEPKYNNQEIDYAFTLDTAKHIAMLERTDVGRQIRQYFIEAEKKSRTLPSIPTDPLSLALQAALETRELVLANNSRMASLEADVASIRASAKIEGSQIGRLHALGQALGKAMGNYRKGWGLYKDRFVLASYRDTLQKDYAEATKWLEAQIQLWGGSVPLFRDSA